MIDFPNHNPKKLAIRSENAKIIKAKNIIENIISSMQPFLNKKDSSAITSHIYFEVNQNCLTLKSTDYEMGLEATINNTKAPISPNTTAKITINLLLQIAPSNIFSIILIIFHFYPF